MNQPADAAPTRIAFHFDVMCPWAYQTSKWIRTVRETVPLEIAWRFCSLEEINRDEGKKHPWERDWSYGWGMLRVAAMLRRTSMDDCDRFYEAAGRALHEEGRKPHRPEVAAEICAGLGIDPGVVLAAIDDPTTHDEVRADHDAVVGDGGFGVPTIVFPNGRRVYGPVVAPAPTGADAIALWNLTVTYTEVPFLYELKTPKTDADLAHIGAVFAPYLNARDWESREKPAR
ncbi:MAG TPA: DsbA family protein [Ilumatobacter sp.]|nr:DsbA family protein [Ilumatobacter sp.]